MNRFAYALTIEDFVYFRWRFQKMVMIFLVVLMMDIFMCTIGKATNVFFG